MNLIIIFFYKNRKFLKEFKVYKKSIYFYFQRKDFQFVSWKMLYKIHDGNNFKYLKSLHGNKLLTCIYK